MIALWRAQGLQRRFQEAEGTLDQVKPFLRDDRPKLGVRYLLERGRVRNSAGKPSEADPFFREAWTLPRRSGLGNLAIDAAHMVAIVTPPDTALAWNRRALDLAEKSEDVRARRWLGSLYNNLGWTHHDKGDHEEALRLFRKALEWRKEQGQPLEIRIAEWSVARVLRSLGRAEEGLEIQLRLAREGEADGEPDGFVYEELGECLATLGREREAQPWFVKAYEVLSKDPGLSASEPERLARLARLGGVDPGGR